MLKPGNLMQFLDAAGVGEVVRTRALQFLKDNANLEGRVSVRIHLNGPGPLDPVLELHSTGRAGLDGFVLKDGGVTVNIEDFDKPMLPPPVAGG